MRTTRRDLLTAAVTATAGAAASVTLAEGHGSDEGHEHSHDHQDVPSDPALRVKALESLLVAKGLVDPAAIDAMLDAVENKVGPHRGALAIAKAWTDRDYKQRLLSDGAAAFAELGFGNEAIKVVENTPTLHNVIVCTLCSCYPWSLIGLPPTWYKSAAYRSRTVIDPRGVLREFGLTLNDDVEIRVWDSTAELRYLVLPELPSGAERMSEAELASLVTRDCMIGVRKVVIPQAGSAA